MRNYCLFAPGDRVHRIEVRSGSVFRFPIGEIVVSAVADLSNPDRWYTDPRYWSLEQWGWTAKKTRLEIACHPQRLFFDGILDESGLPSDTPDPEGKGRQGFSGFWFEKC